MVRLRPSRYVSAPLKLLDRVAELSAAKDFAALSHFMVDTLPRVVDCDWCSFNEIRASDGKILVRSGRMQTSSDDELNRIVNHHPVVERLRAMSVPTTFVMSDVMDRAEFHRSFIYQNMFRQLGVEHQMCLSVNSLDHSTAMIVGFNRSTRDFSIGDRQLLEWIAPHLRNAWGNVQLIDNLNQQVAIRDSALYSKSISLISLGAEQKIAAIDAAGRARIKHFYPDWSDSSPQLPDAFRLLLARMKLGNQRDAEVDRDGSRLNIRLLPAGCLPGTREMNSSVECEVLLLEERCTRIELADLRICGLTAREAEILYWIIEGKTDPVIATILDCSPRTIHKHVEHILKKLNVESRTSAAARALERFSSR